MNLAILASIEKLEAGGVSGLKGLILDGVFGRGGISGHHIVYGHGIQGVDRSLDGAIRDWIAQAMNWDAPDRQKELPL